MSRRRPRPSRREAVLNVAGLIVFGREPKHRTRLTLKRQPARRRRNFKAASNSPVRKLMPVILPLGRARDATKPHLTGILGECRRRSGGLLCRPRPQGGEAPRLVFQQPAGPSCNWYHAAQTRRVSPPGLRLHQAKLSRKSNQLARGRFRRFESYMPSHAVVSNRRSAKEKLRPEGSARRAILGPTHVQAALGRPCRLCWAAAPSRSVRSTPSQNC